VGSIDNERPRRRPPVERRHDDKRGSYEPNQGRRRLAICAQAYRRVSARLFHVSDEIGIILIPEAASTVIA
jgi:hypothetical protein